MSQQTVQPTTETKTPLEVPVEKPAFLREIQPPQAVIEVVETSKNAVTTCFETVVARWRALPRERKRVIALVGLSVAISVTMSVIATVIARLFSKEKLMKPHYIRL